LNPGTVPGPWIAERVVKVFEKAAANQFITASSDDFYVHRSFQKFYLARRDFLATKEKLTPHDRQERSELSFNIEQSARSDAETRLKHQEYLATLKNGELSIEMSLRGAIQIAKRAQEEYIETGLLKEEMLRSCWHLARIEWAFRQAGGYLFLILPKDWELVDESGITEISDLIGIIDPKIFTATKRCILNPNFSSRLLRGDADLLIDDRLIEIKVTKSFLQDQRDWDQLLGYFAMYRMGGIVGLHRNVRIRHLGIYSARFARYQEIDLAGAQLDRANKLSEWIQKQV